MLMLRCRLHADAPLRFAATSQRAITRYDAAAMLRLIVDVANTSREG